MRNFRTVFAGCLILMLLWSLAPSAANSNVALGFGLAQAKTCPDIVKAALATASKACASTGRNKACYGNISLNAEAQPGVSNFTFSKPGDFADLNALRTIQLGVLDTKDSTWGIALMRIQANLPDTAPGQNVTMLLFGDVGVTEDPNSAALLATPAATEAASAISTPAATPASFKPMQAFYFRTGVGDPACAEAPRDGILIQSPQGSKQKVTLSANGVQLDLGSTAFLQAQPGGEMIVSTLEGSVTVTAFGQTQTAAAGTRVRIPLGSNLIASGPPSAPETYDYGTMLALPVQNLPKAVTILVPKPPSNATTSKWKFTLNITSVSSGPCVTGGSSAAATVQTSPDGKTFWLNGPDGTAVFTGNGETFTAAGTQTGITTHYTVHFTSPTHVEGDGTFTGYCSGSLHLTMDKVGP